MLPLQYCRVSKNGLCKYGQAGILPKNNNMPGWNEELQLTWQLHVIWYIVPDYVWPYVNARVCLYARASALRKL